MIEWFPVSDPCDFAPEVNREGDVVMRSWHESQMAALRHHCEVLVETLTTVARERNALSVENVALIDALAQRPVEAVAPVSVAPNPFRDFSGDRRRIGS